MRKELRAGARCWTAAMVGRPRWWTPRLRSNTSAQSFVSFFYSASCGRCSNSSGTSEMRLLRSKAEVLPLLHRMAQRWTRQRRACGVFQAYPSQNTARRPLPSTRGLLSTGATSSSALGQTTRRTAKRRRQSRCCHAWVSTCSVPNARSSATASPTPPALPPGGRRHQEPTTAAGASPLPRFLGHDFDAAVLDGQLTGRTSAMPSITPCLRICARTPAAAALMCGFSTALPVDTGIEGCAPAQRRCSFACARDTRARAPAFHPHTVASHRALLRPFQGDLPLPATRQAGGLPSPEDDRLFNGHHALAVLWRVGELLGAAASASTWTSAPAVRAVLAETPPTPPMTISPRGEARPTLSFPLCPHLDDHSQPSVARLVPACAAPRPEPAEELGVRGGRRERPRTPHL